MLSEKEGLILKKFILVVVCSLYLWPQGNNKQTVVRKPPHKEENVNSKFIVTDTVDTAQNIPGGILEEQLPQFIPNADGNASIIIYKLPLTEDAFNYLTEVKVRQ